LEQCGGGCTKITKPFWGDSCSVKDCCESREHTHCGLCSDFPCELLNSFAYDAEQGDDGKRIETCRMWANYDKHRIAVCELSADDVISVLEKEAALILATCADNRVTSRLVSHVNDGLTVYFQTGEHYLKTQQMRANPSVAMSFGAYDIEGISEIMGHPADEANQLFIEKYKAKHPNHAGNWSVIPNQVVVKVVVKLARQWRYVDGKPVIAIGRF
jgi:nitroimidazol reductase NimA-like FMN-containing flavoprotein (pyridoxamine 5'-phosphate oxidase superfamily)